jgi:uncharacterized SAM-binding protein YcdF (DUF218 family)
MSFYLTKALGTLLLPPLNCFLLAALGFLLLKKRAAWGKACLTVSFLLLFLLSSPWIAQLLIRTLPTYPPAPLPQLLAETGTATVILGAGIYQQAPEYDNKDTLGGHALERVRYGAYLFGLTGSPILVSGGNPSRSKITEAAAMKKVLMDEFHVPVTWTEEKSKTTFENAQYTHEILSKQGIKKIYLVTHSYHMPRAVTIFEEFDFTVIPAPTIFPALGGSWTLLDFLPSASGLGASSSVLHEWIGRAWYQIKISI